MSRRRPIWEMSEPSPSCRQPWHHVTFGTPRFGGEKLPVYHPLAAISVHWSGRGDREGPGQPVGSKRRLIRDARRWCQRRGGLARVYAHCPERSPWKVYSCDGRGPKSHAEKPLFGAASRHASVALHSVDTSRWGDCRREQYEVGFFRRPDGHGCEDSSPEEPVGVDIYVRHRGQTYRRREPFCYRRTPMLRHLIDDAMYSFVADGETCHGSPAFELVRPRVLNGAPGRRRRRR